MTVRSCKVAVIGAGLSGLVVARELLREAHDVTVFEKSNRVGGSWIYEPCTESDMLGLDPARTKVHGSLYTSLRTNLPRPIMGFTDYPFTGQDFGDARDFPRHEEVLRFLEAFSRDFGLMDVVEFGSEVVKVRKFDEETSDRWMVKWRKRDVEEVESFEAVVVCNGHYFEPMVPEIPGVDRWPGKQVHSHNYRTPELYENQVVVIFGMGASGFDISAEIANVAKEVHIAAGSSVLKVGNVPGLDNIFEHQGDITRVEPDGQVCFADGFSVIADVILYCTGYKFVFPFLETNDITVDDNRVGPLYKHVFSPKHGPWLSFVGLPSWTITFLMVELQSRWIAHVLSGKCTLPSENEMTASVKEMYDEMEETGKPKRHTHLLYPKHKEYLEWLATETGLPQLEEWWFEIHEAAFQCGLSFGQGYRNKWGEMPYNQSKSNLNLDK